MLWSVEPCVIAAASRNSKSSFGRPSCTSTLTSSSKGSDYAETLRKNAKALVRCGSTVSLGEIEHKKLRGEWDEPKIHFCIVCASASCPDLRNGAFVGSKLREQMDEQAAAFVANETKGLTGTGASRR